MGVKSVRQIHPPTMQLLAFLLLQGAIYLVSSQAKSMSVNMNGVKMKIGQPAQLMAGVPGLPMDPSQADYPQHSDDRDYGMDPTKADKPQHNDYGADYRGDCHSQCEYSGFYTEEQCNHICRIK